MDSDPGGPKTCGSCGSGSPTLPPSFDFLYIFRYARESGYLDREVGRLASIFRLFFKGIQ
jgi:hypothetical protein